jgi:hypothetical protein
MHSCVFDINQSLIAKVSAYFPGTAEAAPLRRQHYGMPRAAISAWQIYFG